MLIIAQVRDGEDGEKRAPHCFPLTHHMNFDAWDHPEVFPMMQYLAFIKNDELTWAVYDGQEVGDKFVIENEVLSLEEVRERNLKPRYSKT